MHPVGQGPDAGHRDARRGCRQGAFRPVGGGKSAITWRPLGSAGDPEPEPTDRTLLPRPPRPCRGCRRILISMSSAAHRPVDGRRGARPVHPRRVRLAGADGDRHVASVLPGPPVAPIAGALLDRHGRTRLVILDYAVALARARPDRRARPRPRAAGSGPARDHDRQLADLDPVARPGSGACSRSSSRSGSGSGSTRSTRTATSSRRSSGRRSRRCSSRSSAGRRR